MSERETGPLGQCVYTMSTGRRCQKDAEVVMLRGPEWIDESKRIAYGYCRDHFWSITRPRDPRIHKTAEPLTRVAPVADANGGDQCDTTISGEDMEASA